MANLVCCYTYFLDSNAFATVLDASSHLYNQVCLSVGRLVGRSVTLSLKIREINVIIIIKNHVIMQ